MTPKQGDGMLKTIAIGSCVFVQGNYVRDLGNGRIEVRVGDRRYSGVAVS